MLWKGKTITFHISGSINFYYTLRSVHEFFLSVIKWSAYQEAF